MPSMCRCVCVRINTVVRRSSHTLKIGCHANRHGCPLAEADSRQGRRDASASGACSPCLRLRLDSADVHPCLFWLCTVLSSSYVRHAAAVQELKVCTCHNPSPLPAHDRGHRVPSTCAHPAALLLRAGTYAAGPTKLTHPCARDRPTPDANAFSRQFYMRTSRSGALNRCAPRSMSLGKGPDRAPRRACRDSRQPSFCLRKRV